jgi:acetyl-CoA carboxylase beta subunit
MSGNDPYDLSWGRHPCAAINVLRAENERLKAELVAIKARRCETCKHVYHSELIPTRWVCVRLNENFEVSPDSDFCSHWQDKEAADA